MRTTYNVDQALIDSLTSAVNQLLNVTSNLDNRLMLLEARVDQLTIMMTRRQNGNGRQPNYQAANIPGNQNRVVRNYQPNQGGQRRNYNRRQPNQAPPQ